MIEAFEIVPNPTGKGAPRFGVSALAVDARGAKVDGVTYGAGSFFDASTGERRIGHRKR